MRKLNLYATQHAIMDVKTVFQKELSSNLHLIRVSAPLFVLQETGLNDNLSGSEQAVSFNIDNKCLEIVHSLAKWKREAMGRYSIPLYRGLYADMNAIRQNEELSNIHSIYVDQWDWEFHIKKEDRTVTKLQEIVRNIYISLLQTEREINSLYPVLNQKLPATIHFLTSQELLDLYPDKTPKEREHLITKKHGAVFITQIGNKLSHGETHDMRAPDYDDWELNGDILVYHKPLDMALELSSMGIRVCEDTLVKQLKLANKLEQLNMPYHQQIVNKELPYTVGGGIGQSRLAMFFLEKQHIGEVQVSYWPEEYRNELQKEDIFLL